MHNNGMIPGYMYCTSTSEQCIIRIMSDKREKPVEFNKKHYTCKKHNLKLYAKCPLCPHDDAITVAHLLNRHWKASNVSPNHLPYNSSQKMTQHLISLQHPHNTHINSRQEEEEHLEEFAQNMPDIIRNVLHRSIDEQIEQYGPLEEYDPEFLDVLWQDEGLNNGIALNSLSPLSNVASIDISMRQTSPLSSHGASPTRFNVVPNAPPGTTDNIHIEDQAIPVSQSATFNKKHQKKTLLQLLEKWQSSGKKDVGDALYNAVVEKMNIILNEDAIKLLKIYMSRPYGRIEIFKILDFQSATLPKEYWRSIQMSNRPTKSLLVLIKSKLCLSDNILDKFKKFSHQKLYCSSSLDAERQKWNKLAHHLFEFTNKPKPTGELRAHLHKMKKKTKKGNGKKPNNESLSKEDQSSQIPLKSI